MYIYTYVYFCLLPIYIWNIDISGCEPETSILILLYNLYVQLSIFYINK